MLNKKGLHLQSEMFGGMGIRPEDIKLARMSNATSRNFAKAASMRAILGDGGSRHCVELIPADPRHNPQ
jgi:hypothetical protein